MKGQIKSYWVKSGYGFIGTDKEDVFFHITDWHLSEFPEPGMNVSFNLKETKKGTRAVGIRRL